MFRSETQFDPCISSVTTAIMITGDVLLSIDGHNLPELGPLAVAGMLGDVKSAKKEPPRLKPAFEKTFQNLFLADNYSVEFGGSQSSLSILPEL